MAGIQYLTLLRGINVGGNNIIKMADLKLSFENMGFTDVLTYIQSGNVIFRSDEKDITFLMEKIEEVLSERFNYKSRVVVISDMQLRKVVAEAPHGFGSAPDDYRYDVLFLKNPLTAEEAMKEFAIKEGVDTADAGDLVLYFSRLISKASQSSLNRIITQPIYKNMTIRNWNTTTKLLALIEK
jgi:uncharacterized protein (DUF1697 family)